MMVRIAMTAGLLAGMAAMATDAQAGDRHRHHSRVAANDAPDMDFAYGSGPRAPNTWSQTGTASYYGLGRLSRYTASGAVFDKSAMTAAHAWLPFGTRLNVRDEQTGREITVTITDRLPGKRRLIDLSVGAARELGILNRGLTTVSIEHAT